MKQTAHGIQPKQTRSLRHDIHSKSRLIDSKRKGKQKESNLVYILPCLVAYTQTDIRCCTTGMSDMNVFDTREIWSVENVHTLMDLHGPPQNLSRPTSQRELRCDQARIGSDWENGPVFIFLSKANTKLFSQANSIRGNMYNYGNVNATSQAIIETDN